MCGIVETIFMALGIVSVFIQVYRISNQLFKEKLRRETKQILFYLAIFVICAIIFTGVQFIILDSHD